MKKLLSKLQDPFWPKKEAALRFNKILLGNLKVLRQDIGAIEAMHGKKGVLNSGGTVKAAVESSEARLQESLSDCFDYINAKTDTVGWKRRRLIEQLRVILLRHFDTVWDMLDREVCRKIRAGADATSSAETLFRGVRERSEDLVDRYSEGIGQQKPDSWVNRHPMLANGLSATLGGLIGYLFGLLGN
ncbi:MAG: hypothetical protein AAFO28_03685 [Pseudomonadota bacterium]